MSVPVTAVVLAAGGSRRFGGGSKQLLEVDGEVMLHRLCRRLLAAGVEQAVVVVGCDAAEVTAAVADLPLQVVENRDWEAGQSTSVRAGLESVDPGAAGALFVPADQPFLDEETLRRLTARCPGDGAAIVVPVCAGRRGAPVLFGRRFFDELRAIEGDEGGRQILARHAASLVEVELESSLPLLDLDSPEDLPRLAEAAGILPLRNPVRAYAWGSRTVIRRLLGEPTPAAEPEAELWLGAHPSAPSQVIWSDREAEPLHEVVRRDPGGILGPHAAAISGGRLPFLLKVLAAEEPLSVQVHPDAEHARAGFARETEAGLALDDPRRNYRDDGQKPEVLCALEPFTVLHGFRPVAEIATLLRRLVPHSLAPEIAALGESATESAALEGLLRTLLELPAPRRTELFAELDAVLSGSTGSRRGTRSGGRAIDPDDADAALPWLRTLRAAYPDDPAVLAPVLLNLVQLEPGQALFTDAGILHSYLHGAGVELQATSDNVLRGGLTAKHVDPEELLRVLRFRSTEVHVLEAHSEDEDGTEAIFDTPARELRLSVLDLQPGSPYRRPSGAEVEILLCVEGRAALEIDGLAVSQLSAGRSLLVTAAAPSYLLRGTGRVFRATVPG